MGEGHGGEGGCISWKVRRGSHVTIDQEREKGGGGYFTEVKSTCKVVIQERKIGRREGTVCVIRGG